MIFLCVIRTQLYFCIQSLYNIIPPVAVVGLEQTFFRVSESVGVVELCANVSFPVVDCPIKFPFEVNLSTRDGTTC